MLLIDKKHELEHTYHITFKPLKLSMQRCTSAKNKITSMFKINFPGLI